jgi:predicted ribosomally synthesized peptide with SipW-like signal peptide
MGKRILMSILIVAVAFGTVAAGTYALWTDTAESTGNVLSSGDMVLLVNGAAAPGPICTLTGFAPGLTKTCEVTLENYSDVPGEVSFDGTFTDESGKTLSHDLIVTKVEVNHQDLGITPVTLYELNTNPPVGAMDVAAHGTVPVKVWVQMDPDATGNMNATTSGKFTFTLTQTTP